MDEDHDEDDNLGKKIRFPNKLTDLKNSESIGRIRPSFGSVEKLLHPVSPGVDFHNQLISGKVLLTLFIQQIQVIYKFLPEYPIESDYNRTKWLETLLVKRLTEVEVSQVCWKDAEAGGGRIRQGNFISDYFWF